MKKTFKLIDLDCANCAAKMEDAIKKLPGVNDASVSFLTQKMTIDAEDAKFDEIVGDKTAIYISHRLSSCRFCDKIAVFDKGEIVQIGSHEELLADKDGKYYELWTAQAQYYTNPEDTLNKSIKS